MNDIIQNILVVITVGLALYAIFKKFILPVKSKSSKGCSEDDCGCH